MPAGAEERVPSNIVGTIPSVFPLKSILNPSWHSSNALLDIRVADGRAIEDKFLHLTKQLPSIYFKFGTFIDESFVQVLNAQVYNLDMFSKFANSSFLHELNPHCNIVSPSGVSTARIWPTQLILGSSFLIPTR